MKKHFIPVIFSLLFFIFHLFSFSQNTQLDSLLTALKTVKEDTSKVNILNDIFLEYEYTDYKKAKEYLNKALELSQRIDYKKGLGTTYMYLGFYAEDNGDYPDALKNYVASLKIREEIGDKANIPSSYSNIGSIKIAQGNYSEALENFNAALRSNMAIDDKIGMGQSYNNIGAVYNSQGNYSEALKNYFASLRIKEELNDKKGQAASYNNIGAIYNLQKNYAAALKNYFISLKIREEIGDKKGIAASYNNIGTVYDVQGNYSQALINHLASLKIKKEIGAKAGMAFSYNNIGNVYAAQGNYPEALKNQFASLKIQEAIGDQSGIAASFCNIGIILTKQKKYNDSENYFIKALELAKKIGYKELLRDTYISLTNLDSIRGNFKVAYENHKLYVLYRDSLDNEETRKKTIQSQMTYDFEKKELATQAEQDKKDAVAKADKKRHQLFLFFLAALALAIGVIAVVIFRGLQQSKKAKKVIELQRDEISEQKETVEHQKVLVEEKQKEIVDSITYAKRIQYTLLANKQLLDDNLSRNVNLSSYKGGVSRNEYSEVVLHTSAKGADTRTDSNYFVLFKPKDIVSGDFYWASEKSRQSTINKNEKIKRFYIAACDSTGHGVPGAFMSLLNISFLNEAVNEKNIVEPHEILDHVRKRLIENMDGGQYGMDCILIKIETQTSNIQHPLSSITYAAANNSPAIIKNGQLISLDTDKMPVGKGEKTTPFTLRTIELEKGDSLYLYTDGYVDQFGGPKGKKFKYKQLNELLVSVANLPAIEQSQLLNQRFDDWKGNLEQVDDMLVIGIRI